MESNGENWEEIHAQFLCLYPIKLFKWRIGLVHSESWQRHLINNTVQHKTSLCYPPPLCYSRSFLKYIITKLESDGTEVIDEIYEAYADLMARQDESDEDLCFKTYMIDSDNCLVLKESRNLVSRGTTGLCTWQASQYLCEWIIENKSLFHDRVVLELGSGLGLVGLLLCKTCHPKEMIFSDCHKDVILCLIDNIGRNITADEDAWMELSMKKANLLGNIQMPYPDRINRIPGNLVQHKNSQASVLKLDWETVSDEVLIALGVEVDIIIAADVVYDDSIIPSLVRNLFVLIRFGENASQRSKVALVCSTVRNPSTRDHFLSSCQTAGLQYEVMSHPVSKILHYDRSTPIELILLT